MLRWLLALLLVPLADAVLLVVVAASYLGAVPTVALVVFTALVGMLLVRAEGRRTLRKIGEKLQSGELPADEAIDGGLLIAAGAFFLTPGLVTDALGLLIAVPLTRVPIRLALKRFVIRPRLDRRTDGFATGNVYTYGFPEETFAAGWSRDPEEDGDAGTGPTAASGPDARPTDDEGVYDLGGDAYRIDIDDEELDDDPA